MVDQGNGGHSNHNNYYDGHYVDGAADNDLYHQNNYANDHYAAQGNHYAAQGGDHYAAQGEHNTDGYYDEA